MGIRKSIFDNKGAVTGHVPTPDFSYSPNDGLAQLIVNAWVDGDYRAALLKRENDHVTISPGAVTLATESVQAAGFHLKRAVVITEKEYDGNYATQGPDEVVFVLPDPTRVVRRPGQSLLDTARLLMAATPNGI